MTCANSGGTMNGSVNSILSSVFHDFLSPNFGWDGAVVRKAPSSVSFVPRINVKENAKEFVLTAELPGLKKADVTITLENQLLSISGEKKRDDGETEKKDECRTHHTERSFGKFERKFTLPKTISEEGVDATFQEGILTLRFQKRDAKENVRTVQIK